MQETHSPEKPVFLRIAPQGWPFILPPWIFAAIALALGWWIASALLAVIGAYFAFFFRDPERHPDTEDNVAVSPADGRVLYMDEVAHESFPGGRARRVGILLTVFNVHVNRAPLAGRVVAIDYHPGKFHNALFDKSSAENEHNRIGIETARGYIEVRQIAGAIARRIVCYKREGDAVGRAGRIGLIRFGSRTEAYLPMETELWIQTGSRVRGGVTPLGRVAADKKLS